MSFFGRDGYMPAGKFTPISLLADAVEYTAHLFERKDRGSSSDLVTSEIRAHRQQRIRDDVNEINRFYNFGSENKP